MNNLLKNQLENILGIKITETNSSNSQNGYYDYTVNLFPLAKQNQKNIDEVINEFIEFHQNHDWFLIDKSTKGFINIHIKSEYFMDNEEINQKVFDLHYGNQNKTVVIDYSSPNIAKEMHVGHLRSTIIGDSLVRIYQKTNHNVIIQNHIGDFGMQFGLLIAQIEQEKMSIEEIKSLNLNQIAEIYIKAQSRKDDENFIVEAQNIVKIIQSNDKDTHYHEIWQTLTEKSIHHINDVYQKLDVLLKNEHIKGESFYQDRLQNTLSSLQNIMKDDNGTKLFDLGDKLGVLIVQRQNGSHLYATTDLAAIKYRIEYLKADEILYVVDNRQSQHFQQVFEVAKQANWLNNTEAKHIGFGTILGKDNKPFKSRDGGVIKLNDLIEETKERVKNFLQEHYSYKTYDEETINTIAIGVIKFADLNKNRKNDYVFDWDKLLSFNESSSIYFQYTYARINSILNKDYTVVQNKIVIDENDVMRQLLVKIAQFGETIIKAQTTQEPHHICEYVNQLCTLFNQLYNKQQFIQNQQLEKSHQLVLQMTQKTIQESLQLLGIQTLDVM